MQLNDGQTEGREARSFRDERFEKTIIDGVSGVYDRDIEDQFKKNELIF